MIQTLSTLISNQQIVEGYWRMTIAASRIASEIKPGQFINVKLTETNDPLFRRPFSVCRRVNLDQDEPGIEIVYRIVGRGTWFMTELKPGYEFDVIGPLGHGFELRRDKKVHVLLAGGIGVSGVFMLGEEISKAVKKDGLELHILVGALTKEALILQKEFTTLNGKLQVATDDGTYGYHGLVTTLLKDTLGKAAISSDCVIYACGPEVMYKALVPICQEYHIPAQVSMERHMMCGIGACQACVCKVNKSAVALHRDVKSTHMNFVPDQESGYAPVCKDGPVFNIDEVIFDE